VIHVLNSRKTSAVIMLLLFTAGLFLTVISTSSAEVYATPIVSLNLPASKVTIECFNTTTSHFVTKVSNVSSGYSVTNTNYAGWCVDSTTLMTRSPTTHQAQLYSSLNPPSGTLANQNWHILNYVLNHKRGNATEIQDVIWYFVNIGGHNGTLNINSPATRAMVNDATTNGTSFVPSANQVTAVIAYPVKFSATDANIQISIIEVTASATPSSTPNASSTGPLTLPSGYLYLIIAVVIALIILIVAFVLKRRSK
jgi:hypothetical protein